MNATTKRKKGDSKFSKMKRCFAKSNVDSIPPIMNVATKTLSATSLFVLSIRKKIYKLVADIVSIARIFNAIKTTLYLANVNVELLLKGCASNTNCE